MEREERSILWAAGSLCSDSGTQATGILTLAAAEKRPTVQKHTWERAAFGAPHLLTSIYPSNSGKGGQILARDSLV